MADWKNHEVMNLVFEQLFLSEKGTCRLVCHEWCTAINSAESHSRRSMNLTRKQVSLTLVHERFPNLRNLEVELHYNTEPHALFLWNTLENVQIKTRHRTVNGHWYSPTVLSINTSGRDADVLQVLFKTHKPIQGCTQLLPEHEQRHIDRWELNWELAREEDGYRYSRTIGRLEWDELDPTVHQCCDMCGEGYSFGLKGVGQRNQVPIVHQAFGTANKPLDWDVETELLHVIQPNTIHEVLPFFGRCFILACKSWADDIHGHISKQETVDAVIDVLGFDSTLLVQDCFEVGTRSYCQGKKVVIFRNEFYLDISSPPTLPEHPQHEQLLSEIEGAWYEVRAREVKC